MSVKTQGTQIWFVDPEGDSSGATVVKVECATAHNTGGAPASQLDDTCLEERTARRYRRGLREPGQASITINFDPKYDSHMRLAELANDDEIDNITWIVGWSDGPLNAAGEPTALPALDSSDEPDLPTTRSWLWFDGYIADLPWDFQGNALVNSEVSVQRSGKTHIQRKAPA